MSRYFRFQRVADFDHARPMWHATHKKSETYVGAVRQAEGGAFEARRPDESTFQGSYDKKWQAARWLKDHAHDPVCFDDEEHQDESSDD